MSLASLAAEYSNHNQPIRISIRDLSPIAYGERATHNILAYPAKLLPQIPHFFIALPEINAGKGVIHDPFCGTGTVLLEGLLAGRPTRGTDTNPLAVLIARVKTTPLDVDSLRQALKRLTKRIPRSSSDAAPTILDTSYWHPPRVSSQLLRLREAIRECHSPEFRDFFLVCFAAAARKASFADPRLSVPVRLRTDRYPANHWYTRAAKSHLKGLETLSVFSEFEAVVEKNLARMAAFVTTLPGPHPVAQAMLKSARDPSITSPRPDLIITSPPYLGAQKYIRASSLALAWLELAPGKTLRELEDQNIGREHFSRPTMDPPTPSMLPVSDQLLSEVREINPLRAHLATTYLREMREAIATSVRTLLPGGRMILVTGDNTICGRVFPTSKYLKLMAEDSGCVTEIHLVDSIRSRGLLTKRHPTAGLIDSEHIFVMRKSA